MASTAIAACCAPPSQELGFAPTGSARSSRSISTSRNKLRCHQFAPLTSYACAQGSLTSRLISRKSARDASFTNRAPLKSALFGNELTHREVSVASRQLNLKKVCHAEATAGDANGGSIASSEKVSLQDKYPALVTGFFFFVWYFLNVIFNILNKKIYNYFPYPYFVSLVHLVVGVAYCLVSWAFNAPKRAPIDKELLLLLTPVAFCHSLGHVMTNVSFAAVAVSFTHTIKSLEPFFNAAASQFILGQPVSLPLWLSLAPVAIGVSMASMTELSFNWKGFLSAMSANVAFTYRNIYSKKAMTGMDSTNVYAYISILSVAMCLPPAIIMEGPALINGGFKDVIAKVGWQKFGLDLFTVGMFYHLYNQFANNTLERVSPLTHAVGNVLKRVFVIAFSIIVFGNRISTQTGIGTIIAISGVAVYSYLKAKQEEAKRAALKTA